MPESRERPSLILKTLMAGPLESDVGALKASTTYLEDIDNAHPRR
jgi:hypothetical protein